MEEAPENSKESSHSAQASGVKETECESMGMIQLAWDRIHGRPYVNMVKSPQLPKQEFLAYLSLLMC